MNFWEKLLGKDRPLRIKRRKKETVDGDPKPAPKVAEDQQSSRPPVGPTPQRARLGRLLHLLIPSFNTNELRDLCLELDVDYDGLPAVGKASKSRELLRYLEQHGRIDELVAVCSRLRPNVPWDTPTSIPKVADDQQSRRADVEPTPRPTQLIRLRQLLDYVFDTNELRNLCLDLGVDYDSLHGEGKSIKSRELLTHLKRRGRMNELVAVCSRLRPNAPWGTPTSPRYEPYGQETLADLRRVLEENFDEDRVRDLCASLGVDYRRLPGADQGSAARELVLHLARRERLAELVQVCSQRRPDVSWANILDRKDEQPAVDNAQPVSRVELRQMLVRFDKNHLRDICLELGVDYDDLRGAGKQAKIRELIAYFERRGRTAELAAACSRRRSDVT